MSNSTADGSGRKRKASGAEPAEAPPFPRIFELNAKGGDYARPDAEPEQRCVKEVRKEEE